MSDKKSTEHASNNKAWYKRWWGVVIAFIFLPFFVIWYAWAKSSWSKNAKIGATVLASLFIVIVAASSSSTEQIQNNSIDNQSQPAEQSLNQESTAQQEAKTEQPKPYNYKEDPAYLKPLAVPYDKLFRDIEAYTGRYVQYTGEVIQVLGEPGEQQLRVNVTKKGDEYYSYYEDTIFVFSSSPKRVIEKDVIKFTGKVNGTQTYESALGGEITIPSLTIYEHSLLGHSE